MIKSRLRKNFIVHPTTTSHTQHSEPPLLTYVDIVVLRGQEQTAKIFRASLPLGSVVIAKDICFHYEQ